MKKGLIVTFAVVLLFLVTLAAAYASYTAAMLVYVPDYDPNVFKFAIFGAIWLLVTWWTAQRLGVKMGFLVVASVAIVAAAATAVGAADCIYDACPLFWYLLEIELLGFPVIILGLAAGFTAPGRLWIGLVALSLPFVLVSILSGQYLYLAVFLLLALVVPAAERYLPDKRFTWFTASDKYFNTSINNWIIGVGAVLTVAIFILRVLLPGHDLSYYPFVISISLALLGPTILATGIALNILHESTPWYNG